MYTTENATVKEEILVDPQFKLISERSISQSVLPVAGLPKLQFSHVVGQLKQITEQNAETKKPLINKSYDLHVLESYGIKLPNRNSFSSDLSIDLLSTTDELSKDKFEPKLSQIRFAFGGIGETEHQLYVTDRASNLTHNALNANNKLSLITDGTHLFAIILVKDKNNQLGLQLRILQKGQGHFNLFFDQEKEIINKFKSCDIPNFVAAAGEFFTLNGQIILIDPKSGRFQNILPDIDVKTIVDDFLSNYYHPNYSKDCFFGDVKASDNAPLIAELEKREFPKHLQKLDSASPDLNKPAPKK